MVRSRALRVVYAAIAAAMLLVVSGVGAGASTSARLPHVTLIGDSVASALMGDSVAKATIEAGIDLDLEAATCRRLEDPSCPPDPPTAIQLIQKLGPAIGPTVVIAVGYDDFADRYPAEIDDTLAALRAVGVQRVFWLTLRAVHHPYLGMNDEIVAAAAAHPDVSVIDWNVYARSHPEWFQSDGLHLLAGGSEAMATLIHQTLLKAGIAIAPVQVATASLPAAHRGKRYSVTLTARAGLQPYAWSLLERAPKGLHLERSGLIMGTPARPGRYVFDVRVTDSAGSTATRRLVLRVGSS